MDKRGTAHVVILFWVCFIMLFTGCSNDLPAEVRKIPYVLKSDSLFIEASQEVPRRSEGDFVQLKDGSILAVYTRFTGGVGDHSDAVLSGRSSTDNGRTWNEEFDVVTREGRRNVMSVSLLRLQNDSIAVFYLIKNSEDDCYPVMRVSGDEGKTWSASRKCIASDGGYYVLNNSRVIQLHSRRILVPLSQHTFVESKVQDNGSIFCVYSDDNGLTWNKSTCLPKPSNVITQEPGVIELKNGRILMYMRTASGCQYFSYSSDAGQTWSYAKAGPLTSAQSPATIVRNPFNDMLFAVWNDSSTNERTPLCMAVSVDEGNTWVNQVAVENGTEQWYCYPSVIFPDENTVLLSYSVGKKEAWGFGALKFCRLYMTSLWVE